MRQPAAVIRLTDEEAKTLEEWTRRGKKEHRLVERARIILLAHGGRTNQQIAEVLRTRTARVSKWRQRFGTKRLEGLGDAARSGKPAKYDRTTEKRVLALLDESAPRGYSQWNGRLLSEALPEVSKDHVWRILRRHDICLQRRRSWCISTDPEFGPKAADVVGLYLNPPENALVLAVDEKPSIQALERAQGYLRLPDGKAVNGFIADHPDREIHVVLDNLNTHKPKDDRWLKRHPKVRFHFIPTYSSWLNQVEVWFSILSRQALRGASFTSPAQLRQAIDDFVTVYNEKAAPFEWKKAVVFSSDKKKKYTDLCKKVLG